MGDRGVRLSYHAIVQRNDIVHDPLQYRSTMRIVEFNTDNTATDMLEMMVADVFPTASCHASPSALAHTTPVS